MTLRGAEAEVMRGLIPELQAEGYEVFVEPGPLLAPVFLEGLRPDAIALKEGKKLLIQFVRGSPAKAN
jgi:hypothetical protein